MVEDSKSDAKFLSDGRLHCSKEDVVRLSSGPNGINCNLLWIA